MRILVAVDVPLLREGLKAVFERQPDMRIVGLAADGPEALRLLPKLRPDVALLDVRLPGMDGLETARELRKAAPSSRMILFCAWAGEQDVFGALSLGVRGCLLKDAPIDDLLHAVRRVHAGGVAIPEDVAEKLAARAVSPGLTRRQFDVLALVVAGCRDAQIAARLRLSSRAVRTHMGRILRRMRIGDSPST